MDALTIGTKLDLGFAASETLLIDGGTDVRSMNGTTMKWLVSLAYDLDFVQVGFDFGLDIRTSSTSGSESNKDGESQVGFTVWGGRGFGNGLIKAGLSNTFARRSDGNAMADQRNIFRIPVVLQYSF